MKPNTQQYNFVTRRQYNIILGIIIVVATQRQVLIHFVMKNRFRNVV